MQPGRFCGKQTVNLVLTVPEIIHTFSRRCRSASSCRAAASKTESNFRLPGGDTAATVAFTPVTVAAIPPTRAFVIQPHFLIGRFGLCYLKK